MAKSTPQPGKPNNPICACSHQRTSHSRNGCMALLADNRTPCGCKVTYMELR